MKLSLKQMDLHAYARLCHEGYLVILYQRTQFLSYEDAVVSKSFSQQPFIKLPCVLRTSHVDALVSPHN